MLSQLRSRIWQFGGIAIAAAMFTPTAWGDPNLTGHTAQDPTPPWKDPPGDGRAPFDPNSDIVPTILPPPTPISVALRDMGAQTFAPDGLDGWSLSPITARGSSLYLGGSPIGPVPAPGALALLGLGGLMLRTSRRRR